jgi:hypothetical protein
VGTGVKKLSPELDRRTLPASSLFLQGGFLRHRSLACEGGLFVPHPIVDRSADLISEATNRARHLVNATDSPGVPEGILLPHIRSSVPATGLNVGHQARQRTP